MPWHFSSLVGVRAGKSVLLRTAFKIYIVVVLPGTVLNFERRNSTEEALALPSQPTRVLIFWMLVKNQPKSELSLVIKKCLWLFLLADSLRKSWVCLTMQDILNMVVLVLLLLRQVPDRGPGFKGGPSQGSLGQHGPGRHERGHQHLPGLHPPSRIQVFRFQVDKSHLMSLLFKSYSLPWLLYF